ncbi:NAD(P)-dependent dehydrogenase (short-subunit alcohol dehydrogenase family) [Clostridiales Family XIII bacterium PM5-7]
MLKNKVAIVTGGTRGIGFATVKEFLDHGAKVFLTGSRQETADAAVKELKDLNPEYQVFGMAPNLADYTDVEKTVDAILSQVGRIDILVNNAGISSDKPIEAYTTEDFQKIMDLNVNAIFNFTKAVIPTMEAQGGGSIINTSSVVSLYGQSTGVGYPTSKFAVNGMTKSLARELGPKNIRVNAVAPGAIETDMVRVLSDEVKAMISAQMGMRRFGQPKEVANVFLFLASDLASYISGSIVSVDGATVL